MTKKSLTKSLTKSYEELDEELDEDLDKELDEELDEELLEDDDNELQLLEELLELDENDDEDDELSAVIITKAGTSMSLQQSATTPSTHTPSLDAMYVSELKFQEEEDFVSFSVNAPKDGIWSMCRKKFAFRHCSPTP